MEIIKLENITKSFQVYQRKPGFLNTVKSFFNRKYETKIAVDTISLSVQEGEMVGYVGPNGAGKSTTIKILSGILVPTSGLVEVNGLVPHKNRAKNAMQIGVVFGQRTHLHWDLPVMDSYQLYKRMYRIDDRVFKQNVDFFVEKMDMGDFVYKPVRLLSLGQKMRPEIASALLHHPPLLFLAEPTIGLDVIAKSWIREFLRELNRERKVTVILTTHDMDDIEQICKRLVILDLGHIVYDGSIDLFKKTYGNECEVSVDFSANPPPGSDSRIHLIKTEGNRCVY
jgi:ABC-2 type transport system ATP-binding protein